MIFFHVVKRIKVLVQKPRFIWLLEVPTQSPEDDEFNTQPLPADRRNQTFYRVRKIMIFRPKRWTWIDVFE